MFCDSCSKLAMFKIDKKCLKCSAIINNNLSVICENCSLNNKICSICLKKLNYGQKRHFGGCSSCGGK